MKKWGSGGLTALHNKPTEGGAQWSTAFPGGVRRMHQTTCEAPCKMQVGDGGLPDLIELLGRDAGAMGQEVNGGSPKATPVGTQTGRKAMRGSVSRPSVSAAEACSGRGGNYVWLLAIETGYPADNFHSYQEPKKRDLGAFCSKEAAVRQGKRHIGKHVGYSWGEVQESGELETLADTAERWELHWTPPDTEFSRVTAHRVSKAGRWMLELMHGYYPDGFHRAMEPTREILGPFVSKEEAIEKGKKKVGEFVGWEWKEIVGGGDFEVLCDSEERWEACWSPPDSEYWKLLIKMGPDVKDDEGAEGKSGKSLDGEGIHEDHDKDEISWAILF